MGTTPTIIPIATATDNSPIGTIGSAGGNYQGLILQQLQIITILLREGLNVPQAECQTQVQQQTSTLSS